MSPWPWPMHWHPLTCHPEPFRLDDQNGGRRTTNNWNFFFDWIRSRSTGIMINVDIWFSCSCPVLIRSTIRCLYNAPPPTPVAIVLDANYRLHPNLVLNNCSCVLDVLPEFVLASSLSIFKSLLTRTYWRTIHLLWKVRLCRSKEIRSKMQAPHAL